MVSNMLTWESPEANRMIDDINAGRIPQGSQYKATLKQAKENLAYLQKVMDGIRKSSQEFPLNLSFENGEVTVVFYQTGTIELRWYRKNESHSFTALNRKPNDLNKLKGMFALGTIRHKDIERACRTLFN